MAPTDSPPTLASLVMAPTRSAGRMPASRPPDTYSLAQPDDGADRPGRRGPGAPPPAHARRRAPPRCAAGERPRAMARPPAVDRRPVAGPGRARVVPPAP